MSEKVIKKFESEMKDFKDRLEILETKIRRLEKIPKELEGLQKAFAEVLSVYLSALDIDSCIRDSMSIVERASVEGLLTLMGVYLKDMKVFAERYNKSVLKELVSNYMKRWTSMIFIVASVKRIEFDALCSIIIENLGSGLAKKTVALEDVVKFYGAENASTWKRLIKQ